MQINYNRKQKSDIVIPKPSAVEVEKYLKSWKNLKNYKLQEDALDKLLDILSHNPVLFHKIFLFHRTTQSVELYYPRYFLHSFPLPQLLGYSALFKFSLGNSFP